MKRILVIEDNVEVRENLSEILELYGYSVEEAVNGKEGVEKALAAPPDLILCDVMMPELDGYGVLKILSQKDTTLGIPFIFLTAKTEREDLRRGMNLGADDYLTKPFSVREFMARVKSTMRRREMDLSEAGDVRPRKKLIVFDDLEIDEEKRLVRLHNDRIELTPKEFDLLLLLASNPGRSYSRDKLLNLIWGYEFKGYEHNVNSHINRLRTKIEPDLSAPKYILTTWGVGYRFADL